MALSLPIPSSPSSGTSPSSADSPGVPQTPVSPIESQQNLSVTGDQQPVQNGAAILNNSTTQAKRKPSRRANTAERRATHNAVERQRRETLNGRFLDLAALLPNLSQIRRPSKSSIVNSSIAHIHASRRHRLLASRELRLIKLEADALRRELNEWRDRANLPRVEEPVRSEAFAMVLSGEVEVIVAVPGIEDQDEDGTGDGFDNDDDLPMGVIPVCSMGVPLSEDNDDLKAPMTAPYLKNSNPFVHNIPSHPAAPHLNHVMPRPPAHGGPTITQNLSSVSFENPAVASIYESHPHVAAHQYQLQYPLAPSFDNDKASWHSQLLAAQQLHQLGGQHVVFAQPPTAHGPPNTAPVYGSNSYYVGMHRQQTVQGGHGYNSPIDNDDVSSAGSNSNVHILGRQRSSSASVSSGYGSPTHIRAGSTSSSPVSYEMSGILSSMSNVSPPVAPAAETFGAPKRMNTGGWSREDMEGMAAIKPNLGTSAVTVGGGNTNGFAMML